MYGYIIDLEIDKIIKIKHIWKTYDDKIQLIDTNNDRYMLRYLFKHDNERNIYSFAYMLNYIKNYLKRYNLYNMFINEIKIFYNYRYNEIISIKISQKY